MHIYCYLVNLLQDLTYLQCDILIAYYFPIKVCEFFNFAQKFRVFWLHKNFLMQCFWVYFYNHQINFRRVLRIIFFRIETCGTPTLPRFFQPHFFQPPLYPQSMAVRLFYFQMHFSKYELTKLTTRLQGTKFSFSITFLLCFFLIQIQTNS